MTTCFACGGHGVIDKQDLAWKQKWAAGEQTPPPARKKKDTDMAKASGATRAPRKKAVKAAPPVAETGRTPLHQEASDGFVRGVRELLEHGADVNARDNEGRTPLHWPSYRGHLEIVQLLCDHGADINAEDQDGRTPMKMATIGNRKEVITFLAERGGHL